MDRSKENPKTYSLQKGNPLYKHQDRSSHFQPPRNRQFSKKISDIGLNHKIRIQQTNADKTRKDREYSPFKFPFLLHWLKKNIRFKIVGACSLKYIEGYPFLKVSGRLYFSFVGMFSSYKSDEGWIYWPGPLQEEEQFDFDSDQPSPPSYIFGSSTLYFNISPFSQEDKNDLKSLDGVYSDNAPITEEIEIGFSNPDPAGNFINTYTIEYTWLKW